MTICGVSFSYVGVYEGNLYITNKKQRPYDDWVARKKPHDSVYIYAYRCNDDAIFMVYLPKDQLVHILIDLEFHRMEGTAKISVDPGLKRVLLRHVSFESENFSSRDDSPSINGSNVAMKRALACLRIDPLEMVGKEFFGDDWIVTLATKGDKIDDALFEKCKALVRNQDYYHYRTKGHVVGFHDNTKTESAIKIQAAFRGWIARKKYRFNPHTTLGKFLVLKEYEQLLHS